MDVVYVLGNGSIANNEELRYSIRSIYKNMIDLRNIYIIGEKVDFLKDVIFVECKDTEERGWKNVYKKTLLACNIPELSEEFLFMNDDFFVLEPFDGSCWPYYSLRGADGGNCGSKSFQVHCPIKYNKEYFKALPIDLNTKGNISIRSFYGNFCRVPAIPVTDSIIRTGDDFPEYDVQTIGRDFFSISDSDMLNEKFVQWLKEQYKNPSKYEI